MVVIPLRPNRSVSRVRRAVVLPIDVHEAIQTIRSNNTGK